MVQKNQVEKLSFRRQPGKRPNQVEQSMQKNTYNKREEIAAKKVRNEAGKIKAAFLQRSSEQKHFENYGGWRHEMKKKQKDSEQFPHLVKEDPTSNCHLLESYPIRERAS